MCTTYISMLGPIGSGGMLHLRASARGMELSTAAIGQAMLSLCHISANAKP